MVYTANWVIIYHLPPIEGTRHNHWFFHCSGGFLDFSSWYWHAPSLQIYSPDSHLRGGRGGFQLTVEWVRLTRVKNSLPYEGKPSVFRPWSSLEDFSCDFRILHLIVSNPGGLVGFCSWTLILNGCLLLFIGRCTLCTYKMLQTLDILRPSFYFLTGAHKIELCHLTVLKIKHLRRTVEPGGSFRGKNPNS